MTATLANPSRRERTFEGPTVPRLVRAELARFVCRPGLWVLAAVLVLGIGTVAWHNVSQLGSAGQQYRHWSETKIVGCTMVGPGVPVPDHVTCPPGSRETAKQTLTQQQRFSYGTLVITRRALAPGRRLGMALDLLGSPPFLLLMLVGGVLLAGSEYQWGTWRSLLATGAPRWALVAAKAVVLAVLAAGSMVLGCAATLTAYGLVGPAHGAPAFGQLAWPGLDAFATWLGLVLAGLLGVLGSVLARSLLGGLGVAVASLLLLTAALDFAKPRGLPMPGGSPAQVGGFGLPAPLLPLGALTRFLLPASPNFHGPGGLVSTNPVTTTIGLTRLAHSPGELASFLVLAAWVGGLVVASAVCFARQEVR